MEKIKQNPQTRRRLRATLAAALILSCIAAIGPAVPAAAAPAAQIRPVIYLPLVMANFPVPTIFGAEMTNISAAGGLAQVVDAKMSWVRKNGLIWSNVEPNEGERRWSAIATLEQEMKNASAAGLKMILIVRSTPTWAQLIPNRFCGPVREDKVAAFGSFMSDVVKRYSVPPYNVKHWEIWNEPDVGYQIGVTDQEEFGCYGDTDPNVPYYGGGRFAQLLRAAYPRIKEADPFAQVLIGGLLMDCRPIGQPSENLGCAARNPDSDPRPSQFLEGILKGGGGPYFDGVAFHGYDTYRGGLGQYAQGGFNSFWNTTGPSVVAKIRFLKSVLAENGVGGKDFYNTETGVGCAAGCGPVSLNTQAYYFMESFAGALSEGVKAQIAYSTLNPTSWLDTNLLNNDLTPRLSMVGLKVARAKFENATFVQFITQFPDIRIYEFSRPSKRFWVAKSIDGTPRTITLPSRPARVSDPLGNEVVLPPTNVLTIGVMPLYIEWN